MQVWYAGDVIHKRGCMPTLLYGSLYVYTVFCSLYLGCLVAIDAQDHCCKHVSCLRPSRPMRARVRQPPWPLQGMRASTAAPRATALGRPPSPLAAARRRRQGTQVPAVSRSVSRSIASPSSCEQSGSAAVSESESESGRKVGSGRFAPYLRRTLLGKPMADDLGRPWACIDTQTKNGDHQAQIQRCLLEVVGAQRLQHSLGAVFVLLGCLRVAQNPDAAIDSVRDVRVRAYKRRVRTHGSKQRLRAHQRADLGGLHPTN